jgi:hypothetical protein
MARTRSVKPEFFDDPDVIDLSMPARLLFVGLWTQADRRGRLLDEPRRLKIRLMPGDDVDINALLDELVCAEMIARYEADGRNVLCVLNFERHQQPHPRESESVLPAPPVTAKVVPSRVKDMPGREKVMPSRVKDMASNADPDPDPDPDLDPVCDPDPVSGPGRSAPAEPRPARTHAAHRSPLVSLSAHKAHASCGRPCVPAFVHAELRLKHGGAEDSADAELRAWYAEVREAWDGKPIGDDDIAFWRHRWLERTGSSAPNTARARAPSIAELAARDTQIMQEKWAKKDAAARSERAR